MFLFFFVAFIAFLTPTGPITILIFKNSMLGKYGKAIMITVGASVVNLVACCLSLIIVSEIVSEGIIFYSRILSALVFFILGVHLFMSKPKRSSEIILLRDLPGKDKVKAFLIGFFVTLFNPGIILSWLAVTTLFVSFGFVAITNFFEVAILTMFGTIGVFAGAFLMMFIVYWYREAFSEGSIRKLMKFLGVMVTILSFYFLYSALFI
jgi:threonine/homoserine/homoserine lactone efflux protein